MIIRIFKAILIIVLVSVAGFIVIKAAADDNISGYAWSETIGWISFNCTDTGSCGTSDYGVNLDTSSGKFSGHAWSENIGWISFNESDLTDCPQTPCRAEISSPGQLGKSNVDIIGWARALAYTDGWIRFDHGQADEPYIDTDGEFHNWAWGDTLIGWISFNCVDRGVCGTSDYKVILSPDAFNRPPRAVGEDETWECCADSRNPTLHWTYSDPDGDPQAGYWIQIDDNKNFSSPEIDTGAVDSSSTSYHPAGEILEWDTRYYWRVKVKDDQGTWSDWSSRRDFTTPEHAYPSVDFIWSPLRPNILEPVQFTDQSICYDDDINGSPCTSIENGGNDSFKWTIPKTQYADPLITFEENPVVSFSEAGNHDVILEVTDSDGNKKEFVCSTYKTVHISEPLPEWEEITPK